MKKVIVGILVAGCSVGVAASSASAGQPSDPGCFGQDRADILHGSGFIGDDTPPGAPAWGAIAGERAGDNGNQNRAYKTGCGGDAS
jgi:hypothetical protein